MFFFETAANPKERNARTCKNCGGEDRDKRNCKGEDQLPPSPSGFWSRRKRSFKRYLNVKMILIRLQKRMIPLFPEDALNSHRSFMLDHRTRNIQLVCAFLENGPWSTEFALSSQARSWSVGIEKYATVYIRLSADVYRITLSQGRFRRISATCDPFSYLSAAITNSVVTSVFVQAIVDSIEEL